MVVQSRRLEGVLALILARRLCLLAFSWILCVLEGSSIHRMAAEWPRLVRRLGLVERR